MASGPVQQRRPADQDIGAVYPQSNKSETLSGDTTLSRTDEQVQILDAGGAARNVDLPADEEGLVFEIVNASDAAEDLTVRDSDGNTVHVVSQSESGKFYNYGGGWVLLADATASGGQDV